MIRMRASQGWVHVECELARQTCFERLDWGGNRQLVNDRQEHIGPNFTRFASDLLVSTSFAIVEMQS